MLQFVKSIAVGLPFGFVIAGVEPYPNSHDLQVFAVSATFFLAVAAFIKRPQVKRIWLTYGLATVFCYVVPFLWFWWGAMPYGWWYPPQPQIVEQFVLVDGESSYDAKVSNLFLVLWLIASVVFAVHHLTRRFRRRAASSSSPELER